MKCRNTNVGRRLATVLCMFCVLFLSSPAAFAVNAKEDAKLTVSDATVEGGGIATVTVTMEGNPGIWGLKFKVGYDHSAFTLQSVANGTVFEDGEVVMSGDLSKEQFVYVAASGKLENVTSDGVVLTLNFLAADGAESQSCPVSLEVTQAINTASEDIMVTAVNGNLTVKGRRDDSSVEKPEDLEELEEEKSTLTANGVKTGDHSNRSIGFALMAIVLSSAGICGILYIRRGRKGR